MLVGGDAVLLRHREHQPRTGRYDERPVVGTARERGIGAVRGVANRRFRGGLELHHALFAGQVVAGLERDAADVVHRVARLVFAGGVHRQEGDAQVRGLEIPALQLLGGGRGGGARLRIQHVAVHRRETQLHHAGVLVSAMLAHLHGGGRLSERPPVHIVAFLAPDVLVQQVRLHPFERVRAVPLPYRFSRGTALDLRPQHGWLGEEAAFDAILKALALYIRVELHPAGQRFPHLFLAVVAVLAELHGEVHFRQPVFGWPVERGEGLADGTVELGEEARQQLFPGLLHLGVAVGHAFFVHLGDDLVDGLEFAGPFEQRIEGPLAGEEADAVLVGELVVVGGEFRGQPGGMRLSDYQRHPLRFHLDLVDGRQGLEPLVAVAFLRLEDRRQAFLEFLGGLVAQVGAGGGGYAGDEVLHVAQVQAAIVGGVQVPGGGGEAGDDVVLQVGDVAAGGAQGGDDLRHRQALHRVRHVGERGDEQQAHHVLGVFAGA